MCSTLLCPPSLNSCTHKHFRCSHANPWAQCRQFSSVKIIAVELFGLFVCTANNPSRPIMLLVDTLLLLYRHYLICQLKIIQCAVEKWNSQGRHLTEPNLHLMLSCRYRHSLNRIKLNLNLSYRYSTHSLTIAEHELRLVTQILWVASAHLFFLHVCHVEYIYIYRYICVHACMHAMLTSRMVF